MVLKRLGKLLHGMKSEIIFLLIFCTIIAQFTVIHKMSFNDSVNGINDDHFFGGEAEHDKVIKRDLPVFLAGVMSQSTLNDLDRSSLVEVVAPDDELVRDHHASRIIRDKPTKMTSFRGDRSPGRINSHVDETVNESVLDIILGNSLQSHVPLWSMKKKTTTTNTSENLRRGNVSTSLRQLGPEVFDAFPEQFSPFFRNPCWGLDSNRKPSYCLPYFFLAGMPKCGTSDLWDKLISHPHIVTTSFKELHWWTRRRIATLKPARKMPSPGLSPDPRAYYRRFANEFVKYGRGKGEDVHKIIAGDGSASTLWDNQHWKLVYDADTRGGPPHVISELISAVQPDARAIVILRDPAERLYSDYIYFKDTTKTPEEFHRRVQTAIFQFKRCLKRDGLRKCTYSTSSLNRLVRLEVGLYIVYIRDWLKSFPRSRLKVITTESWKVNCSSELAGLYSFLELEPVSYAELSRICGGEAKNRRSPEKSSLGSMLPDTKRILDQFYSRYNRELARTLRDDRFLWSPNGVGTAYN